jgi:LPPG:FO 2-phospho-L-lactate transferase
VEAISTADVVIIGPSNPPLSIWPILAVPGIRDVVESHARVVAVSPLIGGKALKGPADAVMASLGLPPGNAGVLEAYHGLIDTLVIDSADRGDVDALVGVEVVVTDTRIGLPEEGARLAKELLAR